MTSLTHLELLAADAGAFDAAAYGALLLIDPEEGWLDHELEKLTRDVQEHGLGLVVAADWYAPPMMASDGL